MSIQKINRKSKSFLVRCKDLDGTPISATFATRSEAETFERQHSKEKILPNDIQISGVDRADVARIRLLCNEYGVTLSEAYSVLQKAFMLNKRQNLSIEKAKVLFIDYCIRKGNRPRTYTGYEGYLNHFVKWCETMKIQNVLDVTRNNAQSFILQSDNQSHTKSALRACWSFLLESDYVEENIFKNIKVSKILKDKKEIEFMSVKDTIENLKALPEDYKPMYALMTFAGIRPEEIISDNSQGSKLDYLKFSDIDFNRKRITIRSSVSKTRDIRFIEDIPNLFQWLEPIKTWKAIYPIHATYARWITVKSKLPNKIPHDGLRHSFATYAYYYFGIEKAVDILGHDYNTYKKHYKGLTTPAECKKYFKILPKK